MGTCGIHQSIPLTFNTTWALLRVSSPERQDFLCFSSFPITTFLSTFSHIYFLFSSPQIQTFPQWWTQVVFYLWILAVVSELARGPATALGVLWAFSQRCPRHDYCYSEREAGSGTVQRGVWSGHGRNGTASTFHTSLGVTANFLYCTFDWKHIWNIFSWSHLRRTKEKKKIKAVRMRSKLWVSALS